MTPTRRAAAKSTTSAEPVLYDSTNFEDIPALGEGDLVAGYINGAASAWPAAGFRKFPGALQINVTGTNEGTVLDIEKGDATIATAPGWVAKRQAAGVERPWLYIDKAGFAELRQVMGSAEVGYWVADWTGERHDVDGADATQYASPDHGSGGHFDLSSIVGTLPTEPGSTVDPSTQGGFDLSTLPTLQHGASGKLVQSLQALLNTHGDAGLAIDGDFGPKTEEHVCDYQKVFGIPVTGIVDATTWAALLEE